MWSQLNTVWQLYLFLGVMVGIGLSGTDVMLLSTTARWFVKKRGMMSGIVKIGTGVGMLAVPLVATGLISAYDWDGAYKIMGAVTIALVVLAAQFLRRDPSQMGQLPDGGEEASAGSVNSTEVGLSFREAIHTSQFWVICAAYLTIFFCAGTILVHIAPHAVDLGFSATLAGALISAIGGASIVGRLIMGIAGDRVGNKQALIICFVVLIAAVSLLLSTEELWTLYLFAACYGFAHGGFFALMSPTVAALFGTRSLGVILGIVIFSGTVGGTIGPVLAGYIFDVTDPHSYGIAFWILLSLAITGCISVMSLRSTSPERRTAD